jgi:nitrous oxidase accessory protein
MSKSVALLLVLVLLIASCIITFLPVQAEYRTIVVPDDYSTIKEAVNAAKEGETIFVKKGTYEGTLNQTLVITKTLSLIGEDANTTIIKMHPPLVPMRLFTLEYMGYLEAIKVEANGFKLANLTVTGAGSISVTGDATEIIDNVIGIRISITGNAAHLAGNIISRALSSTGNGTRITGNTLDSINLNGDNQTIMQNAITGTADFLISCVGSNNNIALNNVTGNTEGIYSKGSNNAIQENYLNTTSEIRGGLEIEGDRNTIANNSPASFIRVGGASNVVFGNTILGNLAVVGNNNFFFSNYLQGLVLGNRIRDASNNTFHHNNFDFVENEALPAGDKTFTVWAGVKGDNFLDNGLEGNFWSDYSGIDWNLDGVGDMPYVIDAQDTRNYHYMADFDVADVVLIDHHPLMAAFDISNVSTEETFRIPWTFVIILIIGISAGLTLYFKKRKR